VIYLLVALTALVAILCWVCYQLGLQNGRLALRVDKLEGALEEGGFSSTSEHADRGGAGLAPGSLVRDFALPLLEGGSMTLSEWVGRRVLLAFVNPDCEPSATFLFKLPPRAADADPVTLLVSSGDAEANRRMVEKHELKYPILLQEDGELSSLYGVRGTPSGYVIEDGRTTVGPQRVGAGELLAAMGIGADTSSDGEQASKSPITRSLERSRILRKGLKAGTTAPDFELPRLDGSELTLDHLRGRRVLLVFSDPHCSPCQDLAPKLEKVHRRARNFGVVMISRGDVEVNRAKAAEHRLTFPIVLQRHWEISRAYGMFATPIAYLIDENGILAHDVAVGGEAILELADLAGSKLATECVRSDMRRRREA
jgi:peroxiredoxin